MIRKKKPLVRMPDKEDLASPFRDPDDVQRQPASEMLRIFVILYATRYNVETCLFSCGQG